MGSGAEEKPSEAPEGGHAMSRLMSPRLWKPAGWGIAGTAFAGAWLVHGGHGWTLALMVEVVTIAWVVTAYIQGGRRTEEGTLASERDERQRFIGLRSRALAGSVAMLAAFVGVTVAVAVRGSWWWPCAVILGLTGLAYLQGLSRFGVGEEGPAEEEQEGYQPPSPVRP